MEFKTIEIRNSPIEFVLVGPSRGKDAIFARSDNAGLDLKGLAIERFTDQQALEFQSGLSSLLLGSNRQLNVVESYDVDDLDTEYDDRKSPLRFAWVGYCSQVRRERIEQVLNRVCTQLRDNMLEKDADVELSISPLILNCSLAHQRRLRSRNFFRATMFVYLVVGITAVIAAAITAFSGLLPNP